MKQGCDGSTVAGAAVGLGAQALQTPAVQGCRWGCCWETDEIFHLLFCLGIFDVSLGLFLASFQRLKKRALE